MSDEHVVYCVVVAFGRERMPMVDDRQRLLTFDRRDCAHAFAHGCLHSAPFDSASVASFDDEEIASVLDRYDAHHPHAFEAEQQALQALRGAFEVEPEVLRNRARWLGRELGPQALRGLQLFSPD
jgi:hypothetical protein